MVKDVPMAKQLCIITPQTKKILESPARPIVICPKKDATQLTHVSELSSLGIMLPYSGLHYLLFDQINEPLVMTSANVSGQPITSDISQQPAIHVLDHNRTIAHPIDDSVVKPMKHSICYLRRSRGYVPSAISVSSSINQTILAMGAEMNNSFAIYKEGKVYLSPYIGNTSHHEVMKRYQTYVNEYLSMLQVTPNVVIVDKHPTYETRRWGTEQANTFHAKLIEVQHHQAHMHSVMLEHNLPKANGIIMDGTGYGDDATIWGGEVFANNVRIGSLEPQRLIGGDQATNDIRRLAFAILSKQHTQAELKQAFPNTFTASECNVWTQQLQESFNCPSTTSAGRVLDAAAFILGLCNDRDYDGRAAMLLESCGGMSKPYDIPPIIHQHQLMTTPLIEWAYIHRSKSGPRLAATVQHYLITGLMQLLPDNQLPTVFSGGCAANTYMQSYAKDNKLYVNEKVPCGDGGIAFGQIGYYLANARHN
jgi:hydrogenase maturation protein HypF